MRASSIRKALPQDEKAIREIAEAAYGIYLERMDKKPAPMLEDYAARIAAGQAYALDDGKCVQAFMVLVPQDGETMLLDNIAVRPQCQKSGYGMALMSRAEHIARDASKKWIILYTNEAMRENLAWYPRLGYEDFEHRTENGYRRAYFRKAL